MLTNKDYCDYDTCVALIELGYNRKSNQFYIERKDPKVRHLLNWGMLSAKDFLEGHGWLLAINLYEAQKWLREEKGIELTINPEWDYFTHRKGIYYIVEITYWKGDKIGYITDTLIDAEDIEDETAARYKTYEEALSEGIKEAVKILKENYE